MALGVESAVLKEEDELRFSLAWGADFFHYPPQLHGVVTASAAKCSDARSFFGCLFSRSENVWRNEGRVALRSRGGQPHVYMISNIVRPPRFTRYLGRLEAHDGEAQISGEEHLSDSRDRLLEDALDV